MTAGFTLDPMDVALPAGAFPGGGRDVLRHRGTPVCAFTRGRFRPSLHPVWTPAGFVVTEEQPADHPHHRGIWCASDHVGLLMQGPDGTERYDYCFYVDEVFQGRMPGQIRQTALCIAEQSDSCAVVVQDLDWVGPAEWGAPGGRLVLRERRTTAVSLVEDGFVFDMTSDIEPGSDVAVALGPTRHAWFNARVAVSIALDDTTAPHDDQGRHGASRIPIRGPAWVDYSGPVGGGACAGLTVVPTDPQDQAWFVSDWGVLTVGCIRDHPRTLQPGEMARFACRIVAHDGAEPHMQHLSGLPFVTSEQRPISVEGTNT